MNKKCFESWNRKKEKKARFKRKIRRLRKRGCVIYGGYIPIGSVLKEMPDKEEQKLSCTETFIKGIKTLLASTTEDPICVRISREAAEILLREQEPTTPEIEGGGSVAATWWFVCGECHGDVGPYDHYCRECGRKIKWERA